MSDLTELKTHTNTNTGRSPEPATAAGRREGVCLLCEQLTVRSEQRVRAPPYSAGPTTTAHGKPAPASTCLVTLLCGHRATAGRSQLPSQDLRRLLIVDNEGIAPVSATLAPSPVVPLVLARPLLFLGDGQCLSPPESPLPHRRDVKTPHPPPAQRLLRQLRRPFAGDQQ